MSTRMFCHVHKTGGARPGFRHTLLMVTMERVKVAGRVARIYWGSKIARLLEIVNTCVGWNIHACMPSCKLDIIDTVRQGSEALDHASATEQRGPVMLSGSQASGCCSRPILREAK